MYMHEKTLNDTERPRGRRETPNSNAPVPAA